MNRLKHRLHSWIIYLKLRRKYPPGNRAAQRHTANLIASSAPDTPVELD